MKYLISIFFLLFVLDLKAQESKQKLLGVFYYVNPFGLVHKNPSRYSGSFTSISCNHPVKIFVDVEKDGKETALFQGDWNKVGVGPYIGYIHREFLSEKQVDCIQDRYPQFFDKFGLDLTDVFHWGKLYDQYAVGRSRVR